MFDGEDFFENSLPVLPDAIQHVATCIGFQNQQTVRKP